MFPFNSPPTKPRNKVGPHLFVEGPADAVESVADALNRAAVPPPPWGPAKDPSEDFKVFPRVRLEGDGREAWPITVLQRQWNSVLNFLFTLVTANPELTITLDHCRPGAPTAKLVVTAGEVREFGHVGQSWRWLQHRPGWWVHESAGVLSDREKPFVIVHKTEKYFGERRPGRL